MSDLNCEKDHRHTPFCYIHGEPVDPKLMENYNREMRERVIPAIIEDEKQRAELANLARSGLLPVVRQIQDDARKEATTWYAQYQAWMKRGMEVEAREADLKTEIERLRAGLEKIIEMNRQHALDQYGDAEKAETWSCVTVAREALTAQGAKDGD